MLYIYSHYLMKLHEFFFFLQAHAGIFFSSSISCMNFFFASDTPPPRISNGPPLSELTRLAELTCKLRLHVPGWLKNALRLKMHNTRKIVAKFLLIYIMVCILHVMTSLRIEGSFSRDNFV